MNSIVGGFPGYDLKVYDQNNDDTIDMGSVPFDGSSYTTTVEDLPAGEYHLIAIDAEGCYSYPPDVVTLEEPDPISIQKVNEPYHDTVDISCFGADDGIIDIQVLGGHTASYPNTFSWSGPIDEDDLVAGDSLQNSLGPGTYDVDSH